MTSVSNSELASTIGCQLVSGNLGGILEHSQPPRLVMAPKDGPSWEFRDGRTRVPTAIAPTTEPLTSRCFIGSCIPPRIDSDQSVEVLRQIADGGGITVQTAFNGRNQKSNTWVYLYKEHNASVELSNLVKVGVSTDPEGNRLNVQQFGSPSSWHVVKKFGAPSSQFAYGVEKVLKRYVYAAQKVSPFRGERPAHVGELLMLDYFRMADLLSVPETEPSELVRFLAGVFTDEADTIYNLLQQVLVEGNTTVETRHIGVAVSAETS